MFLLLALTTCLPPNRYNLFQLTGLDTWKPHIPLAYGWGTEGKASDVQARPHYKVRHSKLASDFIDEESRPMPVTILRQQGIHPNPRPREPALDSIMDD